MSRAARGLALAACLSCAAAVRADELGPLFLASVRLSAPADLALEGPLVATLALHPGGAAKVASAREWFHDAAVKDGALELRLDRASPRAAPARRHRAASFLVDFDDPAVAALRGEIVKAVGPEPTAADLARFVDGWITRKSMARVFDIASTVATRREGDCTEHAVLLAAAARLFGKPSRVVMGIALLRIDGRLHAAGHAWVEIHDGERWRTADAAALGMPSRLRYVPLAALVDEGPGHAGAAWELLTALDVKGVTLAAGPPP